MNCDEIRKNVSWRELVDWQYDLVRPMTSIYTKSRSPIIIYCSNNGYDGSLVDNKFISLLNEIDHINAEMIV